MKTTSNLRELIDELAGTGAVVIVPPLRTPRADGTVRPLTGDTMTGDLVTVRGCLAPQGGVNGLTVHGATASAAPSTDKRTS